MVKETMPSPILPMSVAATSCTSWAKASRYDFWGIPPEVPEDGKVEEYGEGGLWGVYRFKQGFGGHVVKYPGALDYSYSRLGYLAYQRYFGRRGDQAN